jgi:hypothetical protein
LTWGLRHFCGNRKRTLLRLNIDDAQARGVDYGGSGVGDALPGQDRKRGRSDKTR